MQNLYDVHQQFADFFKSATLKPFAYLVSKKLSEGHICVNLTDLSTEMEDLSLRGQPVGEIEKLLAKEHLFSTKMEVKQPFILHNSRLYLQRYFAYETMILDRILGLLANERLFYDERVQQLEQQRAFIQQLFENKLSDGHVPQQAKQNTPQSEP